MQIKNINSLPLEIEIIIVIIYVIVVIITNQALRICWEKTCTCKEKSPETSDKRCCIDLFQNQDTNKVHFSPH